MPSNWLYKSRPDRANRSAIARCAPDSTDTAQYPQSSTAACIRTPLSTHTSTSGGSSEREVNAFAVIACATPSWSVLMMVMPDANCPNAARNSAGVTLPLGSEDDTPAAYARQIVDTSTRTVVPVTSRIGSQAGEQVVL